MTRYTLRWRQLGCLPWNQSNVVSDLSHLTGRKAQLAAQLLQEGARAVEWISSDGLTIHRLDREEDHR